MKTLINLKTGKDVVPERSEKPSLLDAADCPRKFHSVIADGVLTVIRTGHFPNT